MKIYQKKRLKVQAQTILFCAVVIWMFVNALSRLPAMAFHSTATPTILSSYEDVALYSNYAYASSESGKEAIAHKVDDQWAIVCQSNSHFKGRELVNQCDVPIGIARHLKVLKHNGMSHELYVADI